MHVGIVSLFPALLEAFAGTSVVGRAREAGLLSFHVEDLRAHGVGRYKSVDDTPYGGGSGMVLRVDCVVAALDAAEAALGAPVKPLRVLLTPQGERFTQARAEALAAHGAFILTCGRYEGFDERVRSFVDLEISLGDFVLAGGEVAAMAVVEAAARLVPGVLGNRDSARVESFSASNRGLLEFPQFTRPLDFRGLGVPDVLRGGNHAQIEAWRTDQALLRTRLRRPDLAEALEQAGSADARSKRNEPR
ncbi:MAG TPA: tRNA (guanosine(37)-N1)-methyltransferase TrmD [Polyangiaceae bacterium]|nr:tRNA (guanosine(37)-N1)-methyltransferase TrmD [Polyangiaceae bacterium]